MNLPTPIARFFLLAFLLAAIQISVPAETSFYNVREYGARGDKTTNDTKAIQAAINACHQNGGGTVLFPAGDYLSSTLVLRDHITLHLTAGATIWASPDPEHYEALGKRHLLSAENVEHISVIGEGVLHGQGIEDYGSRWGVPERPPFRTGILLFQRCRHVTVRDITILYSDSWTLHFKQCEIVNVDGVTIFNNPRRLNSDGIDPNCCKNVHISNCHIVAGDDCIVFKATEEESCENIVVTNCTLETTTTALKLGTESRGDFRDIHVSNCTIRNTRIGIGFFMKDGATMERVTFSGISIECFDKMGALHPCPIFMDIEKRHPDSKIGTIRDVTFRDISIKSGSGILIQGMPESPIEDLTLDNVSFQVSQPIDYSKRKKQVGGRRTTQDERDTLYARQPSYVTIAHCSDFAVENLHVSLSKDAFERYERAAFSGHHIQNGIIRNVRRTNNGGSGQMPVIRLENGEDILVTDCLPSPGASVLLGLEGAETSGIFLGHQLKDKGTDLLYLGEGVRAGAVHAPKRQ